jgi:DNA-binding LytR/AlgR family response regulator
MEKLLIYDKINSEREQLRRQIQNSTAMLSNASLKLWECGAYEDVRDFVELDPVLQLAVMEISSGREISLTRQLRNGNKDLDMMLVADASISPMEYLTPEIRAASLLIRPCTEEMLRQVVYSFMADYFRSRTAADRSAGIVIENRDGITNIPYGSIYYIEAREKKVFIRQKDREYSTYDTLENIGSSLPDYFVKCHRSYIINKQYLERVKLSENTIYLENGITIPLSRSYKADIKEIINGR